MSEYARRNRFRLAALAVFLVALLLYWPTLRLPLLYDDLLHIRIAKQLNLATVWIPTEAFGFYRPLTFFPMLVIRGLFGYYPAWLLHGLNVGQHAVNVILVIALARRLGRNRLQALATGLLLALFPFAYQAIAVYGHNVHPTTAGLMLVGLHSYLHGIERQRARWWLLTGLLFVLSLLSHESAILFGPLAALVHWNHRTKEVSLTSGDTGQTSNPDANLTGSAQTEGRICGVVVRRPLSAALRYHPWLLFLILGGLYAVVYQFLPLSRTLPGAGSDGGLWPKTLYLLQAAAYPLTWFAHRLPDARADALVLGGMAVALGLTVWSACCRANRVPLILGWCWWALASVLLVLPLPSDYLLNGPRLLYLGAVGLALLWPVLLDPLRSLPRAGWLIWATALGLILWAGWGFVRDRLDQYAQLASPVALVDQTMAGRPPDEGILLINLPEWLAPPRNTYPLGSEHVSMLGYHLFVEELMVENLREGRPVRAIKLPELLRDPGYSYSVFGETDLSRPIQADWSPAGSQVFVITYTEDGVESRHVGQLVPPTEEPSPAAFFGPYHLLEAIATRCDGGVQVATRWGWTLDQLPPATISLFVQLLDSSGRLIAQADAPPLGVRFDLIAPLAGWRIADLRTLRPIEGAPATVLVGMYDYLDGERLPGQDSRQRPLPNDTLALTVEDCP